MNEIQIGEGLTCNLSSLMVTRLLAQANSGAGKSWLIRRLLEQSHGKIQQIVIDPEGEFATLREKFDYVLAARTGGDTVADTRSAKLLAERLLELGVSAILDIYELKAHERIGFVKNFLEAMVNAPKALWHPVMVVVDECHVYCPEKGHGEAESSGAVIDLCTRGRKRGFCAVLATQRISKLNKDAAAELNNKLIGRSSLDIDMKRAASELGFSSKEEMLRLRDLDNGNFFAFGPALCRQIQLVKVGPVLTTHPESGSRLAAVVPPPTAKVRAILSQLADLPAEAEAREKTVHDLKQEIATLKRNLTEAKKLQPAPAAPLPAEKVFVVRDEDMATIRNTAELFESLDGMMRDRMLEVRENFKALNSIYAQLLAIKVAPSNWTKSPAPPMLERVPYRGPLAKAVDKCAMNRSNGKLPPGEKAILRACAQFEGATREELTVLTGYKRSSRDAYIQRLREKQYVAIDGDKVMATDEGVSHLGDYEPLPTGSDLAGYWLNRLPEGERKILEILLQAGGDTVDREQLSNETGYARSSRDAYVQRMKAKRIVVTTSRGVSASPMLFD